MSIVSTYCKTDEAELIALLERDPEWQSFTEARALDVFTRMLNESETYTCRSGGVLCGYLRALIDGFGLYVSELYVAPDHRNNGYGRLLLRELKQRHPDQAVYVLSDEDAYYEKLDCRRVGSVFQL